MNARKPSRGVVKNQVQRVEAATDRFTPAGALPVNIDYLSDAANPYSLAMDVVYDNGVVRVLMEKGFKWDGASIPAWIPTVPWVATMLVMHWRPSPWLWLVTAFLVAYTISLLPYMQKMGKHARGCCVHDKLCRAQTVVRVVADAIMYSILESDGVRIDVRWWIYLNVRIFGFIPWWKNGRALRAKVAAAQDVEVVEIEK